MEENQYIGGLNPPEKKGRVLMANEGLLMELNNFKLPGVTGEGYGQRIDDINDFDGLMLNFPRVKIPGGGTTQFELPGENPDQPNYVPYIEGIIIMNHNTNAYWPSGSEYDMNVAPECTSVDGVTGYGCPGGACELCPHNQYGSDPNGGKGKACKNMRSLYILQNGSTMPINLMLPPTSLRPYSEFATTAFLMRNRPLWGSLVRIELRKENNGSNNYAVAVFKRVGDFSGEKLAEIEQYVKGARAGISQMLHTRAINSENRNEPLESYTQVVTEDAGDNPFNMVEE